MKFYLLPMLMLVFTCSFAQQGTLPNDLAIDVNNSIAKYFPIHNGELLYSNYLLDPQEFNKKIALVKEEAYQLANTPDPKITALKRLDVDYRLRNLLVTYKQMFGMDSTAMISLLKVVAEKSNDPQFGQLLITAQQKIYAKRMTTAQLVYTDSLIFSKADPNIDLVYAHSEAYRAWVKSYLEQMYKTKYQADTTFRNIKGGMPLSVITNEIKSPIIRDVEYYLQTLLNLKVVKDPVLFKKLYDEFNVLETNVGLKKEVQTLHDNFQRMQTSNSLAPDFTYGDISGKQITLSNLRGKFVYIDVWATWCIPCKAEIPSLKKMEEEFRGKNIHFVSLSVDKQEDAGTWHKYVTSNKLSGYQIMADKDFQSDFIKKFNIASIPRFILIDPAGKVVDADAKRPSDPKLKEQLNKLL